MISLINFNSTIIIFKPNIWSSTYKIYNMYNTIFSSGKSFNIFSAIDISSQTITLSWLCPNFFLNSMASGNLQRSITSRVKFSIIKAPFLPSKYALHFCFSSYEMFFGFFAIILFNSSQVNLSNTWMFCLCFDVTHFLPQFNYILFFIVMLYCFNITFFPCFFCNFYNHFIHTQEKDFFWWLKIHNCFFF